MVELYGPAFVSAYGEKPSPLWQAAIADLSDDECRVGLTSLAKQARDYPANLTQFVAACRPVKGVRYLGGPSSAYNPKALEGPRADLANVEARLANMRRAVGAAQKRDVIETSSPACTCLGLGECEVCQAWAKRMGFGSEQAQPA